MQRILFAISVIINLLLSGWLYQTATDYDRLLEWACDNGNGGSECGEM